MMKLVGLGMKSEAFDKLESKKLTHYTELTGEVFGVLDANDLGDSFDAPLIFKLERDAIRCARALSNGNVDHLVVRIYPVAHVRGNNAGEKARKPKKNL